ncbi:MAG: GNAT family N-acetyltransferase [Candidatus Marinimicrobia bacterium]|nr:GNAT family N-acetyltransferase [Candidatus Neomarinimicrobiota bacterium]
MTLTISLYQQSQATEWDDFIRRSNNGTIFHLRRFLGYHPPERFQDHSLIFTGDKEILALFPAAIQDNDGISHLISHPGSSFGGFVTPVGLSFKNAHELVLALLEHARREGIGRITMTHPATIYNRRLSNYVEFELLSQGFASLKREVSSILYLEKDPQRNLDKFTPASRRAVRKAQQSGVQVRLSDDWPTFYNILLHNLKRRHGVSPTHTLEELQRLVALFPDDIRLLSAFLEGRMIAGLAIFDANPEVTLTFYISHDEAYQEYRAVNLLFYEFISQAIAGGFKYLDFGTFSLNMQPNFGLARFKESFGSSGLFRETMTIALGPDG